MVLRDEHLHLGQPQLPAADRDVPRHRHLRDLGAVLGDQPLPDPAGGMTLFAVHGLICHQPAVDNLGVSIHRRPAPSRIRLPWRRDSRRQRLANRAPVSAMTFGQLPDRQVLQSVITPDLLKQLHSSYHLTEPPCSDNRDMDDPNPGGANIGDDTPPTTRHTTTSTPGANIRAELHLRRGQHQ